MKRLSVFSLIILGGLCMSPTLADKNWAVDKDEPVQPQLIASPTGSHTNQIMKVLIKKDTECRKLIKDDRIYSEGWDTMPQPRFWGEIMVMESEYSIVNLAGHRTPLAVIPSRRYDSFGPSSQKAFKDSVKVANGLPNSAQIFVTGGKKHFYLIKETIPNISRAIDVFTQEGIDPWYAQCILMIESPGMNRTSEVGASGPFQIMPDVAREQGLIVNEQVDERNNFRKAAQCAARLLRKIYIPKVRALVQAHGLPYSESDTWFKMLVLHAYHGGPGNVNAVINKIRPNTGGSELMKKVWTTEAGGFQTACQNYSQLAVAAMVELDRVLAREAIDVCEMKEQGF